MEYAHAHALAEDIRATEEYKTYHGLKDIVNADETTAALIREYRRLQMTIQVAVMSGKQPEAEDSQRFSALTGLLYAKPEVSQFLVAEMRLQQMLADILKIVTEAAGIELNLPGT